MHPNKRQPLFKLAIVFVAAFASSAMAAIIPVTVDNHSFETLGVSQGGPWYALPNLGAWTDGNPGNPFESLIIGTAHFPVIPAPDGTHVLNLAATSPMSQNLLHAIAIGDMIMIDFYLGNSATQANPAANLTAFITLDGVDVYSELVTNTALDGQFVLESVQWTATSSGNLGIKFSSSPGAWIDNVSVNVTPVPEPGTWALFGLLLVGGGVLLRGRCQTRHCA